MSEKRSLEDMKIGALAHEVDSAAQRLISLQRAFHTDPSVTQEMIRQAEKERDKALRAYREAIGAA